MSSAFRTTRLGDEREAATSRARVRQREDYNRLIRQAASSQFGLGSLTDEDRDLLAALATGIGLSDDFDLSGDVDRVRSEPERKIALKEATDALAGLPRLADLRAKIDAIDDEIRAAVAPLIARKSELLDAIERCEAARQRVDAAQRMVNLVYSGAEHLRVED